MTEAHLQTDPSKYQNQPFISVTHIASGATADVVLHGGQLVSFKTGGAHPTEVLYKSATSPVGLKKTAIRGGVPICLPQFSDYGPLSVSHGFARILTWEHVPDPACAVVKLTSKSVRKQFEDLQITNMSIPHNVDFTFTVRVCLVSESTLEMSLTVENAATSCEPLPFTTCLHTYFAVSSLSKIRIDGAYEPLPYLDTTNKRAKCEPDSLHEIKGEVDRIYFGGAKTRNPLQQPAAIIGDAGRNTQLQVFFKNIDDLTIWNPGEKKSFKDMPAGDHDKFLCIEGCVVQPNQVVAPGQSWTGGQTIKCLNTSNQEISRL